MANHPDGGPDAASPDVDGDGARRSRRAPAAREAAPSPVARRLTLAVAALAITSVASLGALGVTLLEQSAASERLAMLEDGLEVALAEREAVHGALAAVAAAEIEAELAALRMERDGWETEAGALRSRLAALASDLTERQTRLIDAAESEAELGVALEMLRARLRDAVAERDAAEMRRTVAEQQLGELRRGVAAVGAAEAELGATLDALTVALDDGVRQRDEADRARAAAVRDLAVLTERERQASEARERAYGQLEDAVAAGLGGLEAALSKAGLNVDRLVEQLRRDYSGVGGPFIPAGSWVQGAGPEGATVTLAASDAARIASLMGGLERASLLQVAATKIPLAHPVRGASRHTSGFGVRRDPKNGRMRMHAGADFAGAVGTPIVSPADGVVTYAGWQSGYGRVVRMRHAFGFETVFAHLNATRVKVGDRVARGDRIGDMGRTGRTTGVHLHYEIRLNDKPVNPMRYIEAARNVL